MTDLADLSLVEAADAVRNGDATSMELLDACWRNMEAVNPQLNATIWLDREGAEQAARAADRAVRDKAWLGPLHGVPMMHKDMYYQAGRLSTCGSALRRDFRPAVTATVIERLSAAGAYTFGGLNMAEFAQNPTGHNRDVRRLPQSVEPALHHRRLVVRLRRLGGGAVQLHGARLRHRRFDPAAGRGLRRHRHQADADPRVALRRDAAVVQRRQCRAAGPHRARLRTRHDADRRARSARSDQFARAGAGLRGGARRRPARPAHRRAVDWFLDDGRSAGAGGDGARGRGAGGARRHGAADRAAADGCGHHLWQHRLARRGGDDPRAMDARAGRRLRHPYQRPDVWRLRHPGDLLRRGAEPPRPDPEGVREGGVRQGRCAGHADDPHLPADAGRDRHRPRSAGHRGDSSWRSRRTRGRSTISACRRSA